MSSKDSALDDDDFIDTKEADSLRSKSTDRLKDSFKTEDRGKPANDPTYEKKGETAKPIRTETASHRKYLDDIKE